MPRGRPRLVSQWRGGAQLPPACDEGYVGVASSRCHHKKPEPRLIGGPLAGVGSCHVCVHCRFRRRFEVNGVAYSREGGCSVDWYNMRMYTTVSKAKGGIETAPLVREPIRLPAKDGGGTNTRGRGAPAQTTGFRLAVSVVVPGVRWNLGKWRAA